jgi:hypothetical protein
MSPDLRPLSTLIQLEVLIISFAVTPKVDFDAGPLRDMHLLKRLEISGVNDCDVTVLEEIRPVLQVKASGVVVRGW